MLEMNTIGPGKKLDIKKFLHKQSAIMCLNKSDLKVLSGSLCMNQIQSKVSMLYIIMNFYIYPFSSTTCCIVVMCKKKKRKASNKLRRCYDSMRIAMEFFGFSEPGTVTDSPLFTQDPVEHGGSSEPEAGDAYVYADIAHNANTVSMKVTKEPCSPNTSTSDPKPRMHTEVRWTEDINFKDNEDFTDNSFTPMEYNGFSETEAVDYYNCSDMVYDAKTESVKATWKLCSKTKSPSDPETPKYKEMK